MFAKVDKDLRILKTKHLQPFPNGACKFITKYELEIKKLSKCLLNLYINVQPKNGN